MPFARIDLAKGKSRVSRHLADVVYEESSGSQGSGRRPFISSASIHPKTDLRSNFSAGAIADFVLIQVTSTVGKHKESKLAFFRYVATQLKSNYPSAPMTS